MQQNDNMQGGFYYQFTLFFTVWFVAGPAMILLGNSLIAKWVREKVIVSVEHCVAFVGHAAFLLITRYMRLVKTY